MCYQKVANHACERLYTSTHPKKDPVCITCFPEIQQRGKTTRNAKKMMSEDFLKEHYADKIQCFDDVIFQQLTFYFLPKSLYAPTKRADKKE